ncbi:phosphohistidine phosphatase SixA [Legionella micdadei]|uniref:Phosphohistidine phosphatase SixA n=1 Tax=Legionella micdadei TaxID=451 RepID=A0A098GHE5_LEGMI|nr:phosphohistidine phosphatase SixA [Legionella micdadei]ARG97155.1 phosphohistidine phosphatase SixA [Legionella micdadei]ARH00584.1 phosphohistidine phosphatase SixA [Legionella micdadei]KTD29246.1 phosphohistidine phosphatase SixA [Legionella micdadei]NSL17381.1 phosphohistidine phosphatase SixA [Legionella micdadei]CEG61402.1 Phosphohistidine phosphatase SixA [Legionella micdadei]
MKIYLVQHGACLEKTINPEQALSAEGKQAVDNLCQFLSFLKLEVHSLWHSEKLRAKQTAEALVAGLIFKGKIESRKGLAPMDAVEPIEKILKQLNQDIVLVGHMPFMGKLVAKLVVNDENQNLVSFVPGTMVCLEQDEDHAWHIQWMINPNVVNKTMLRCS